MTESLFRVYSQLPNFRGKALLGQKILKYFPVPSAELEQKMLTGFRLELNMRDRMQAVMFLKRCHEAETEAIFKTLAPQSRVFFDIGANVGYFSFLVKQLAPTCKVYSFEPLPKNIIAYKKNQKLNSFSDMNLQEVCVADREGETEFLIPPIEESGWGRMAHRELFSGEKIQRQVVTLDYFIKTQALDRLDLMKIDVEGYEFKVLQGALTLIETFRPKICIELNEPCLLDTGTSGEEIFAFFKKHKYGMYAIDSKGLRKVDTPVPYYPYLNYFALPEEK